MNYLIWHEYSKLRLMEAGRGGAKLEWFGDRNAKDRDRHTHTHTQRERERGI